MNKNCPNCGAPFQLESDKCPYCGTLYYDLSAIDFESQKPIFLKFRANGMEVVQKCIPTFEGSEFTVETVDCCNDFGKILKWTSGYSMATSVKFLAIPDSEGHLCTIYKRKE
jgi:hypothetical protein